MSAKSPVSHGDGFYLYFQELLSDEPRSVFLELTDLLEFRIEKEIFQGKTSERLTLEIPSEAMDKMAIAWIKKRELQGAVGGPVGNELGSPDNPWL